MTPRPLAHVRESTTHVWFEHSLPEHLRAVGALASDFARSFGSSDWARVAGIWHDLGKYSAEFQAYIRKASGYERVEAHIEGVPGRVDHSTAGAIHAVASFGDKGRILAYLIAGHHAGLPDWLPGDKPGGCLEARLQQQVLLERVHAAGVPEEILKQDQPTAAIRGGREGFALWVRMLFSCLVDADFLDTERFMDSTRADARGSTPSIELLLKQFDDFMDRRFAVVNASPVNQLRKEVLRQCRQKAHLPPGVFSLSVPTGGGKTLSSLAFALSHAVRHGKKRIIYAIPYTSIIEQTANIFREIFGELVVEHHSNLDPKNETAQSRLATENWDAGIIVTTNVQLFESLFASRTSRARKLHNIAESVVILDEAHLIDTGFLQPILDALKTLQAHYGVTILLSTATQPAFQSQRYFGYVFRGLDNVSEIIENPDNLYRMLKRVEVFLPRDFRTRSTWEDIASELRGRYSVLCIVNRRTDCRELFRLMPEGTFHLSALMCGQHRSERISAIKQALGRGEPVRVISTQLVEAGVDLDFPVVYRAMAGLDSIAQAAGRCNREGRLERGEVVVFVPPTDAPPGILRKAEQATISLLSAKQGDPLERARFTAFFERLYSSTDLDREKMVELLRPDDKLRTAFRTASARFRLIDDTAYQAVFVPYEDGAALIGKLAADGPERWLLRRLQRYSVNLSKHQFNTMLGRGDIKPVWRDSYFGLSSPALYNDDVGVVLPNEALAPEDLVI